MHEGKTAGGNGDVAPLLAIDGIEVLYDHVILALRGVSIRVSAGTIVTLLGANGAGKSTTLKAASRLLGSERGELSKGSISYDSQDTANFSASQLVAQGAIQVMEGRRCFAHLSVEENLLTGAYTSKSSRNQVAEQLEKTYHYFPRLRDRRETHAGYISGGEQQMTAIGRALMANPRLILLDEPSMGLAPQLVEEIFAIVARLNKEEGVSVLLAEQNAVMALKYADHGYVLENGQVVMEGTGDTLRADEGVKHFYLGFGGEGERRSFRDVKHYRRRRGWLS